MRKEFIDSVPPITIREGHVYVAGADGDYVWTREAFREFCGLGFDVLNRYIDAGGKVVSIRRKKRK